MKIVVGFVVFFLLSFIGNQIVGPTRCSDGWASPSIGKQGACSHHGGVNRSPRSGVMILSILGGVLAATFVGNGQSIRNRRNQSGQGAASNNEGSFQNQNDASPKCPICGSDMVLRVAKKGRYAGNKFFGCKQYPRCKGLINQENGT